MSPGLGLGTCVQVAPSQCRIRVWSPAPPPVYPTAHTLVAETARTPVSTLSTVPGSGLGSTVQEEPFQCSVRVCLPPLLVTSSPTAQASHADSTATPKSSLLVAPGLGGCVPVQFWQVAAAAVAGPSPASTEVISSGAASAAARCRSRARDGEWVIAGSFLVWVQPRLGGRPWMRAGQQQWRARVCSGPPVSKEPTAQTLLAEVAATANRPLLVPGLGVATGAHLRPFQCRTMVLCPVPFS